MWWIGDEAFFQRLRLVSIRMSLPFLTASDRSARLPPQRGLTVAAIRIIFLAQPPISDLHKALRMQHGDWLSLYNIVSHLLRNGELQAERGDNVVITQRYPPIECRHQNQADVRPMVRLSTHTNAGHSAAQFYIQSASRRARRQRGPASD